MKITVDNDAPTAQLADGRTIAVPLAWFPRLLHGADQERHKLQLSANGAA